MKKTKLGLALAVGGMVLVGCGVAPGGRSLGWSTSTVTQTPQERDSARYQTLQNELLCPSCEVTGGGQTDCGDDINIGFNVLDTDGTDGTDAKGHLEFNFKSDTRIDLGGKIDSSECGPITVNERGQTIGSITATGTLSKDTGLDAFTGPFTFTIEFFDFGEPNPIDPTFPVFDHFHLQVFDVNGVQVFEYECDLPDGNIQLHPVRGAQL